MTIDDNIRDEKLHHTIYRKAAKIWALSSGKIHKYEYLASEEILPSDQSRIIEQANFTYFPFSKAFEKQIKTIEEQGKKTGWNYWRFKTRKKKARTKINWRTFSKRNGN